MVRKKIVFKKVVLIFLALVLQACAGTDVEIIHYSEPSTDFNSYQTFHILKPTLKQRSTIGIKPEVYEWIQSAVTQTMQQKGLQSKQKNPDVVVLYSIFLKDKWKLYTIESGLIPGAYESMHKVNYKEGTLLINVIDSKTEQVVWRGQAVGSVPEDGATYEAVNAAVIKVLSKYPE